MINKANILSVLMGILGGILMSFVILYIMRGLSFHLSGLRILPAVLAACALPLCYGFVRKMNLSASLTEVFAVLTSFVITILYGLAAGKPADITTENTLIKDILPLSALLHGCAMIAVVLFNRYAWKD